MHVLISGSILSLFIIYDIYRTFQDYTGDTLISKGVIIFSIGFSWLLARKNAFTYKRLHHLSKNLQEEINQKTRRLRKQTKVAVEARITAEFEKEKVLKTKLELETANTKLKEIDHQKTHFFQNISHELRTPLTLIIHPLRQVTEKFPQNEDINTALKNSKRLLHLVNQLLDFQRISSKKERIKLTNINLIKFLFSCTDYFSQACFIKSIDFKLFRYL